MNAHTGIEPALEAGGNDKKLAELGDERLHCTEEQLKL
jgi:hypothetical protein